MATTIDTTSNPLAAYGYDASTGQQLAQQLGMTPAQLAAAFAATPTSPGGGRDIQATINQLQIMKASGMGTSPAASAQPQSTPISINGSYYGSGGSPTGGNMTWNDITNLGYTPSDLAGFKQRGWTPDQVMNSVQKGIASPPSAAGTQAASPQNAFGISTVRTDAQGNTVLQARNGNQIWQDPSGNYFGRDASGNVTPISDTQAQALGFQSANPETNALKQMAQIDPASEALRQNVASSYLPQLNQISGLVSQVTGQAPTSAADALAKYQQLDPQGYAAMQQLGGSESSYLKQATDQLNLGSQLDPVTARQVEQQTRLAQAARGNVYGTPQMAEEAMTTGQAGLALQQQRQQAAQAAQGNMQSYLTSGATLGATGQGLYNQGLSNQVTALGLQQNANQAALGYLGSGQTPYQAGASYLNQANMNAANAAQGGPVYQPAALGSTTQAAQIPQYGLDIGQQSQNWYNSLQAYNGGGLPTKNKGVAAATGAATGALSGAVGGATLGSSVPGIGTLAGAAIGAGAGALTGGAGGYFS
jgi:hypothetical protein